MTDQTIPADKVREIIARHRDGASHRGGMILNDLKALLPLPTLADMTDEEREACRWMNADVEMTPEERAECRRMHVDVKDDDGRAVILNHHEKYGLARVLWLCGCNKSFAWEKVTPRPDLAAAVYYEGTNHD